MTRNQLRSIPPTLIFTAALMVFFETLCFGSLQPGYHHMANTISELGQTGTTHVHLVAFGFFLPVGLLVWLALWLVYRDASDKEIRLPLVAVSCLGVGYAMSAFFPCDPGAPFFGTWRTQVHNIVGFVDYEGSGIGFLLFARYFAKRNSIVRAIVFFAAGVLVLTGLVLLSIQASFPIRGMIQRITEVIQFVSLFFACSVLPKFACRHENFPANCRAIYEP